MMRIHLEGIGIHAPGLAGWEQAGAVLAGRAAYDPQPPARLAPALLPPDVRRRTTEHIRLAVEVASQAVAQAQRDAARLHSVFASSESDGAITHNICEEVARETPEVSPTRFHNSVNNAPAGYWCMATGARGPSTSLAGFDATFAMGLLEAACQLHTEAEAVLLVAHDTPLPEPLNGVRPMTAAFGLGLVLTRDPTPRSLAALELDIVRRARPRPHSPTPRSRRCAAATRRRAAWPCWRRSRARRARSASCPTWRGRGCA
jgi:hypothetical protein